MTSPDRVGSLGMVLPTFPQERPLSVAAIAAAARDAEAAGVGALWACDHLFWHGPTLECFTAVAVASAVTDRCELGTAVLQLPLRRPAAVAKTAASLQLASGGRFVLGVGSGAHPGEYQAAGVDYTRRGRILDRGITELRRAWASDDGRYAQRPVPAPIPVWVGGASDAARRRAAAVADGWIPMFLGPDRLAAANRELDEELVARGRSPQDVTRAALVFVSVGARRGSGDEALAWMSKLYGLPAGKLARHLVQGEAEACAEELRRYGEAGVEHLALFVADDDPVPHVEALAGVMQTVPA